MINRDAFFADTRQHLFHGSLSQGQVDGMGAVFDEWEKLFPDGDLRFLAYMLATAYHETAQTMQPIEEYGHGRGRSYGVPTGPWHQVYDGRGFEQLTWLANYVKATKRLKALGLLSDDEDLAKTPALAMRIDIAAAIMFYGMIEGWFTGVGLHRYFHDDVSDPLNARRIINGTDCASMIAGYYALFLAALKAE